MSHIVLYQKQFYKFVSQETCDPYLSWFCWLAALLSPSSASMRLLNSLVISFMSANLYHRMEMIHLSHHCCSKNSCSVTNLWASEWKSDQDLQYLASTILLNWSELASLVFWSSCCFFKEDICWRKKLWDTKHNKEKSRHSDLHSFMFQAVQWQSYQLHFLLDYHYLMWMKAIFTVMNTT